jgi:hypothetical protein
MREHYAAYLRFGSSLFSVSTHETDRVISAKERFCSIVTTENDDETEATDARQFGGGRNQGHPARDAAALVGRGQDPDRARGLARGRQHLGAVPPRGDRGLAILRLVEGVPGGWHKRRLAGDTARAATSDEVKGLRREAQALIEVVADLTLENRLLKKSMTGDGEDGE